HIFRAPRLHPGGVSPAITVQVVDERGGFLAVLAEKGKGIAFQENRATSGANFKFIVRIFTDTGNEQFPNAAADKLAHGVNAAIPTFNFQDVRNITRAFLKRCLEKAVALNFLRWNNRSVVVEFD